MEYCLSIAACSYPLGAVAAGSFRGEDESTAASIWLHPLLICIYTDLQILICIYPEIGWEQGYLITSFINICTYMNLQILICIYLEVGWRHCRLYLITSFVNMYISGNRMKARPRLFGRCTSFEAGAVVEIINLIYLEPLLSFFRNIINISGGGYIISDDI